MNNLFGAIDSLFESNKDVVLGKKVLHESKLEERKAKYLKLDSDGKKRDDRGKVYNSRSKGPGYERYLYDVIKHLAPAGYDLSIGVDYYHNPGTYKINLMDGNKEYELGQLFIKINDNDEVEVKTEVTKNKYELDNLKNVFGRKATKQEIGQKLAREKGADYDEDFIIDNGAEIRKRFEEQKSEGTIEELMSKIENQIKKLPSAGLLKYTESCNMKNSKKLDEDFSASCPNWLKMTLKDLNRGASSWHIADFSENTEFEPISTDKIKGKNGLTALSREAEKNGEQVFVRTEKGVFGFYDNKWRSLKDRNYYLSSEEVAESIIAAVKTTNKDASRNDMLNTRQERKDAKQGSVERSKEDAGYWDYDKSGYKINPDKYKDMLRDLNKDKLANSDLINSLKQEDYVNRFNDIGRKAIEFIKDSLDISYDSTDSWSGFNTKIVDKIKEKAKAAKSAIELLIRRVDYVKNGSNKDNYIYREPGPDVESWVKEAMQDVDTTLADFEQVVTKAEEMSESTKISGNLLKEDSIDIRKFIYDIDENKGNAWSATGLMRDGYDNKLIIATRNGQSENTAEDIKREVEEKYPELKGEISESGRRVWFYIGEPIFSLRKQNNDPKDNLKEEVRLDDGWGEDIRDILYDFFERIDKLEYEVQRCVRGSYAGFGNTVDSLVEELRNIANMANERADEISEQEVLYTDEDSGE